MSTSDGKEGNIIIENSMSNDEKATFSHVCSGNDSKFNGPVNVGGTQMIDSSQTSLEELHAGNISADNSGKATVVAGVIHGNVAVNLPANIDKDIEATLSTVKEKLKHRYFEPYMPSVPRLKDIQLPISKFFIDLEMYQQETVRRTSSKRKVELEDIILSDGSFQACRTLISGSPGCGKSTLLLKLAHEWAKGSDFMSKFELALIVPLRAVTQSIQNSILDVMMVGQSTDKKLVLEVLRRHESKILLLLDGYDELQKGLENEMHSIIKGEAYPQMTVTITSRRGKFISPKAQKKHIFASHQFMSITNTKRSTPASLCQRHIYINGIKKEKQRPLLEMHLSATITFENLDSFSKALSIISSSGSRLCESPLYLLLIATLISEVDVAIPKTLTQLYKFIITFLTAQHKGTSSADVNTTRESFCEMVEDLFQMKRIHPRCIEDLFQQLGKCLFTDFSKTGLGLFNFGKLLHCGMEKSLRPVPYQVPLYFHDDILESFGKFALDSLSKGKLSFTEQELVEFVGQDSEILKLSLFVPNTYSVSTDLEKVYEPIHKSVFEFFTAYYLKTLFLKNELKTFASLLFSLRDLWPQEGSDSLLFPFLAGLLRQEMHVVFSIIRPMAFQYAYNFTSLLDTLMECDFSEKLLHALTEFLPVRFSFLGWPENLTCSQLNVLQQGLDSRKIEILEVDETFDFRELEPIEVWRLQISLSAIQSIDYLNFQMIKCDEIYCIPDSTYLTDIHIRDKFYSQIRMCDTNHISVDVGECTGDVLASLKEEMMTGSWQDVTIYNFQCSLTTRAGHALPHLISMVRQEKILSLHVSIKHITENESDTCQECNSSDCHITSEHLQQLIDAAGDSQVLCYLFVNNYTGICFTLDISPLFCRKRIWKWLWFWNVRIAWDKCQDVSRQVTVDLLELMTDSSDSQFAINKLLAYPVSTLTCASKIYKKMMIETSASYWIGLNSITELILILDWSDVTVQFVRSLKRLQNLKLLALFLTKSSSQKLYTTICKEIVGVLKSIDHPVFELWFAESNLEFLNAIVNELVEERAEYSNRGLAGVQNVGLVSDLMLYINYVLDSYDYDNSEADAIVQIISLLARFKELLKKKVCNCIHIVCHNGFPNFLQRNQPFGISSFADIFPWDEGFVVGHDLYGCKPNDSNRAKQELKFYGIYPRFTVVCKE